MKKAAIIYLICVYPYKLWAEESSYKTNDLRLSLDSIGSRIVDADNEGDVVNATYLGLGGEYIYNKPTGKFISGVLASGSYNVNNDSKSVGVAKLNADLAKKKGKRGLIYLLLLHIKRITPIFPMVH